MAAHRPTRPEWFCTACSGQQPWPCRSAKLAFIVEHGGVNLPLNLVLVSYFLAACEDMPREPCGAVRARFLGWPASYLDELNAHAATVYRV